MATATISPQARTRIDRRLPQRPRLRGNVGTLDRLFGLLAGAALIGAAVYFGGWAWLAVLPGAYMVLRGLTGHCAFYKMCNISTNRPKIKDARQSQTVRIEPEALLAKLADVAQWPQWMPALESIQPQSTGRFVWRGRDFGQGISQGEASLTIDEANLSIAWEAAAGNPFSGQFRLEAHPNGEETMIHAFVKDAPAFKPERVQWLANALGNSPEQLLRDDLRRLKALIEAGEIPTTLGQPHGPAN